MIMPLPTTVVEAQRKVRGKNGPIQKHRYVGSLSNEWTVLSALWIRQEPHEKVVDALPSLAPRLYRIWASPCE
jgi:hypothetical protein